MSQPLASLSLDLDDKWTYLRTHGRESWRSYPSYLPGFVPQIRGFLADRGLAVTVFVVGRDARQEANRRLLEALATDGHEIANHSENHYPWLQSLPPDDIEQEVVDAECAIELATGRRPVGFRAPGFSGSPHLLRVLARRGYLYDASSFPSFVGPLARMYCALKTPFPKRLAPCGSPTDRRGELFGSWRDGFAPLTPFVVAGTRDGGQADRLVEIPVTTMPILRLPFHMTYLLFLRQLAGSAWRSYLRMSLALCRARGVAPSMLLHPLDFLGCEDEPDLSFFPGMKLARAAKLAVVDETLQRLGDSFRMAPLGEVAAAIGNPSASHAEAREPAADRAHASAVV